MATAPASARVDRKLQLKEVLDWLVEDGMLNATAATKLSQEARLRAGVRHPIVAIAEARIRSEKPPQPFLTPEVLTEWLAARVRMPFYHIDPLKIDLKSVTAVMSSEYAQRRSILPVEVSGREVTIATSEPYISSW